MAASLTQINSSQPSTQVSTGLPSAPIVRAQTIAAPSHQNQSSISSAPAAASAPTRMTPAQSLVSFMQRYLHTIYTLSLEEPNEQIRVLHTTKREQIVQHIQIIEQSIDGRIPPTPEELRNAILRTNRELIEMYRAVAVLDAAEAFTLGRSIEESQAAALATKPSLCSRVSYFFRWILWVVTCCRLKTPKVYNIHLDIAQKKHDLQDSLQGLQRARIQFANNLEGREMTIGGDAPRAMEDAIRQMYEAKTALARLQDSLIRRT